MRMWLKKKKKEDVKRGKIKIYQMDVTSFAESGKSVKDIQPGASWTLCAREEQKQQKEETEYSN